MEYTKKVELIRPGLHTYDENIKLFGDETGLRAVFNIEKSKSQGRDGSLDEIEIDRNFIRVYDTDGDGDAPDKVVFISNAFNISDPTDLSEALRQKENKRILQLEASDNCMCSIYVSAKDITGTKLLAMMRGHIAFLYSLHHDMLKFRHVSEDSHRPSIYQNSPVKILYGGLNFRLFPGVIDENDIIRRATLLKNMYDSAISGRSALNFIHKFFDSGEFESYTCNMYSDEFKKRYKNLAIKFLECLTDDRYTFNIGSKAVVNYFYSNSPQNETIKPTTKAHK